MGKRIPVLAGPLIDLAAVQLLDVPLGLKLIAGRGERSARHFGQEQNRVTGQTAITETIAGQSNGGHVVGATQRTFTFVGVGEFFGR